MKTTVLFSIISLYFLCFQIQAQSTFSRVYTILQTNCAVSSCHDGTVSTRFDASGTEANVYNAIVGVAPDNAEAASKENKLIDPGYPNQSFLLRKIAYGLSQELILEQDEGDAMPRYSPKLPDTEIEIVRQWILFGAPDTGQVVEEKVLTDFYGGLGMMKNPPPAIPAASEGFQLHQGPFFLPAEPGKNEKEYSWKINSNLPDNVEVYRIEIVVNREGHHLALWKYYQGQDQLFPPGLRLVNGLVDAAGLYYNADVIAQFPNSTDMEMPAGTAFFWEENSMLDINYHVRNYDPDSVLACEVYINIYFRPRQPSTIEMHSIPLQYGGNSPDLLVINGGGNDVTFVMEQFYPDSAITWHIWAIQAHTHQLGVDFDVWMRNPDGTKGEQLYEGFYNEDYSFHQGFYDWQHAPFRRFDPVKTVDMSNGLFHEAVFNNPNQNTVYFGLKTTDEMFVTYMHYTKEMLPTETENSTKPKNMFEVYPNPFGSQFMLAYSIESISDVKIELYDFLGKQVATITEEISEVGKHNKLIDANKLSLQSGIYFIRISLNDEIFTNKIVRLN